MAAGDKLPVVMGKEKAVPNGVATLDEDGKLAEAQRPTTDATPTEDSTNPVQSGGVFDALAKKADLTLSNLSNYQKALAALGAGVRPNLLDNWYFVGGGSQQGGGQFPINQRGETQYSGQNVYAIDRWYVSNGEITLSGDDLTLKNTDESNQRNCFAQKIENPKMYVGKTLTFSILYKNSTGNIAVSAYANNNGANVTGSAESGPDGILSVTFSISENAEPTEFRVHWMLYPGVSCTPIAAKMEFGEGQTLAYQDSTGAWQLLPQPDMDYGMQLAKCQRYLQVIAAGKVGVYFPVGYGMAFSTTAVRIATYSPVAMRPIVPTVSFSGKFQLVHGSTIFDVTAIKQDALNSLNLISLNAQATGLTLGDLYQLRAGNDATAKIIISAEL